MNLGDIVYNFRKNTKMTMQEFADRSGLTKGYISMLEKGVNPQTQRPLAPSLDTIDKCAKGMGISSSDLVQILSGENIMTHSDAGYFVFSFGITDQEKELISYFDKLDDVGKIAVLNLAKTLAGK